MDNKAADQLTILQRIEMKLDRIEQNHFAQTFEKLDMARLAFDLRRERDASFPDRYFADHGWDILLELYQANLIGRKLQYSLVGYDANIPITTALRYLDLFMQDGLVYREDDTSDNRQSYVILTPKARNLFEELFQRFQDKFARQSGACDTSEAVKPDQLRQAHNAN